MKNGSTPSSRAGRASTSPIGAGRLAAHSGRAASLVRRSLAQRSTSGWVKAAGIDDGVRADVEHVRSLRPASARAMSSTTASGATRSARIATSRANESARTSTCSPPEHGFRLCGKGTRVVGQLDVLAERQDRAGLGRGRHQHLRVVVLRPRQRLVESSSRTDRGGTVRRSLVRCSVTPRNVWRSRVRCASHGSSWSLTATSTSRSSRGWKVRSRGANACRSPYQSGLTRSSLSIAAQDVTGQQSLSCQTIAPAVRGHHERKCSMPKLTARAWLSCVAQCQSAKAARHRQVRGQAAVELPVAVLGFLVRQEARRVRGQRVVVDPPGERGPRRRALEPELRAEPRHVVAVVRCSRPVPDVPLVARAVVLVVRVQAVRPGCTGCWGSRTGSGRARRRSRAAGRRSSPVPRSGRPAAPASPSRRSPRGSRCRRSTAPARRGTSGARRSRGPRPRARRAAVPPPGRRRTRTGSPARPGLRARRRRRRSRRTRRSRRPTPAAG